MCGSEISFLDMRMDQLGRSDYGDFLHDFLGGRGMKRLLCFAACLLWGVVVSACSLTSNPGLSSPSTGQTHSGFRQTIESFLAEDGATFTISEAQRLVLEEALREGTITFEQYQDAIGNTLACAQDAGIVINGPFTINEGAQPTVTWGWRDPAQSDGNPAVGEHCRAIHSLGIEMAYLNNEVALESERDQLDAYRPQILACIENNGFAPSNIEADAQELLWFANDLQGEGALAVHQCIDEIGIVVMP